MLDNLTRRLSGIFSGLKRKGKLTEDDVNEMLREVRVALLEADVNFAVAKTFIAKVKEVAIGEEVFGSLNADQTIIKIVRDALTDMLGTDPVRFNYGSQPPTVILLCGLQGSGKTTTTAKLAKWLMKQGKKPMLAACDIQRPAAIKQLQVLGEQIEVPVYAKTDGTNPVQIAKEALDRAKHLMCDVLIVDTAGRLQVDSDLMDELKKIHQTVKPSETLLVLDSTTGQEAVNVATAFHEQVELTGAIFTKLDGDTRGGAVLSVRAATGVPVRFIGVGEQTDMLDQFDPSRMAGRILGFGDILGIIERAEIAIDKSEAADLEAKVRGGNLDFNDMLGQFKTMRKMGPIKNVLKMLPGVGANIPEEALNEINDQKVNRIEAIILSMTPKERSNPDIINGSRRKRLAAGSGTSVEEVNGLIKQLYEMRRGMKQLGKLQARMSKKQGRRRR
ncbi:MAG: signal recognition particle protein [Armatimonadetes bacterium 55-13]|nr:signal recognition particle protein [Armatimonadota bacterium]OJU62402.1 MAG: signal recognition particle protein [Armatimonadetes bacterium 55-13]